MQFFAPALLLLAYIGVFRGRMWRAMLGNGWIYTIGGMCYTIYLYHGFFKASIGHFTIGWQLGDQFWVNFLVQMAILVPGILAGSAVLFVLTEKPFMQPRLVPQIYQKTNNPLNAYGEDVSLIKRTLRRRQ